MSATVLFVIAERGGCFPAAALELANAAQELSKKVGGDFAGAILGGDSVSQLAEKLAGKGVPEVIAAQSAAFASSPSYAYVDAIEQIISERKPTYVLFSYSSFGIDVAPRLAARLKGGLVSNCTGFHLANGNVHFERAGYNGKLYMKVKFSGTPPYFVTLEQGAFKVLEGGSLGKVTSLDLKLDVARYPSKLLKVVRTEKGAVDISQAPVVVAGGRGVGNKENFEIIFKLAKSLGGEVGASRPVVDSGWVEPERQVGQSGKTITPKLYVACGISGAIQHLVGMRGASTIVAINKDPEAPIFNIAHFGIVGDLFEIIPPLIEEIEKMKKS